MDSRELEEFRALCERQGDVLFPAASGEDALDELRAELAEYDGYIAGLLESALADPELRPAPATRALDLQAALERRRHERGPAGESASLYLEYLLAIDARLDRATALGLIRLAPPSGSD